MNFHRSSYDPSGPSLLHPDVSHFSIGIMEHEKKKKKSFSAQFVTFSENAISYVKIQFWDPTLIEHQSDSLVIVIDIDILWGKNNTRILHWGLRLGC